jgi:O-antigen/teichoic acid export membrane protein
MAIRAAGILSRFALSLYMARFMGLRDVGTFGIVLGIVSVMPAVTGLGLNYFVSREIIDTPIAEAARKIRDRLCVTFTICAILAAVTFMLRGAGGLAISLPLWKIALITILEVFGMDIHMALIGLRMPLFASFLVFIRTSSWVFLFIAVSFQDTALRTLSFAFDLWLAALALNYLVLAARISTWPWGQVQAQPINLAWIVGKIRAGPIIYASDIAMAGAIYIDRFIVDHVMGLTQTGIYIFFWSVCNSSQMLITSSIIQVALPRLVSIFKNQGERQWRKALANEAATVFAIGTCLAAIAFISIRIILPFVHRQVLGAYMDLFAVMLAASVIKMLADVCNYGLYSRGLDHLLAATNIAGFLISPVICYVALRAFGLNGIGLSMAITASLLLLARLLILILHNQPLPGVREVKI